MMMHQTLIPFNHIDSDILDALDHRIFWAEPPVRLERDDFNDLFNDDAESYAASSTDDIAIMNILDDLWLTRAYDLYIDQLNN